MAAPTGSCQPIKPPGVFHQLHGVEPARVANEVHLPSFVGGQRVISLRLVDVWSRGSRNHHKDQCTPCFSNGSGKPCPRGEACNCCHFAHDDGKMRVHDYHSDKLRKSKGKPELNERSARPPAEVRDATIGLLTAQFGWQSMSPDEVASILRSAAPEVYED